MRDESHVVNTSHADWDSWLDPFPHFISGLLQTSLSLIHLYLWSIWLYSHSTSTSSSSLPPSCWIRTFIDLDQFPLNSLHIQYVSTHMRTHTHTHTHTHTYTHKTLSAFIVYWPRRLCSLCRPGFMPLLLHFLLLCSAARTTSLPC